MKAGCIKVDFLYSRRRFLGNAFFTVIVLIWEQIFVAKTDYDFR